MDTRHLDKTDTWIWSVPFRIQRQTHTDSADLRGILLYITPDRIGIRKTAVPGEKLLDAKA